MKRWRVTFYFCGALYDVVYVTAATAKEAEIIATDGDSGYDDDWYTEVEEVEG